MFKRLTTALEIVGIGFLVAAAWHFGLGSGLAATGLALVVVAYGLERSR